MMIETVKSTSTVQIVTGGIVSRHYFRFSQVQITLIKWH